MKIHVIMPMGGEGSRFEKEGFGLPKPLIQLDGRPFLWWATESIVKGLDVASLTFVVLQRHIDAFGIDKVIRGYYPEARIVVLERVLNGATLTCLAGVEGIDDDLPVIFNDCDHAFRCKAFDDYMRTATPDGICDGSLLTFTSSNPAYSYLRLDEKGRIVGTVEKQAVSTDAICGAYMFRSAALFREACGRYMHNCGYKEYFVSGVYNELGAPEGDLRNFPVDWHLAFGTPEELRAVEQSAEALSLLKQLEK